jgi:hypothetical protein
MPPRPAAVYRIAGGLLGLAIGAGVGTVAAHVLHTDPAASAAIAAACGGVCGAAVTKPEPRP